MLVPDLAQLEEVWLQAVDLLVGLSVLLHLSLQLLLQPSPAVVDVAQTTLELLVVEQEVVLILIAGLQGAAALLVVAVVAILSVALLLKDLDGLIESLNGRPLHLDVLVGVEETRVR